MKFAFCNVARVSLIAIALVALTACGGGGGTPTSYSIGGTVSGLDAVPRELTELDARIDRLMERLRAGDPDLTSMGDSLSRRHRDRW